MTPPTPVDTTPLTPAGEDRRPGSLPDGEPTLPLPGAAPRRSRLAVLGLALALPCGPVGIVLSVLGLRACSRDGTRGRRLALAGLVVSMTSTIFGVGVTMDMRESAQADAPPATSATTLAATSAAEPVTACEGPSRQDGLPTRMSGPTKFPWTR